MRPDPNSPEFVRPRARPGKRDGSLDMLLSGRDRESLVRAGNQPWKDRPLVLAVEGVMGMPAESIDRTTLPIRRPAFRRRHSRGPSRARSPTGTRQCNPAPPEGAPNVLVVLIDDAGFGNPSTFGGPIETPNYTRMAEEGLRYNRFHVTAVCSPTRAAMLTGRNQHRVGFGLVAEFSGPFPGYNATIPRDCATLPRILQENGYMTAAIGKWHMTPDDQQGSAAPSTAGRPGSGSTTTGGSSGARRASTTPSSPRTKVARASPRGRTASPTTSRTTWPTRRSTGCTAFAPSGRKPRGSCTTRLAAATRRTTCRVSGRTSTRASSTPGWDVAREETLARQKELGVVPADTELPENDAFPKWESRPRAEKRLYARQMETYAGYSENADWNVGRVLAAIEEMGELDDTLDPLDLGRQRRQLGGHPLGHVQRDDDTERDPAHHRTADGAPVQARRARGLGRRARGAPLLVGMGVGEQLPVRLGQAGCLPPRGHAQSARHPLPERDLRSRAPCATTSRT